ncbi:class I SAM-dependent methyltransferase [Novilysobacter arseniciresistens]|uniref:class I SAM-dependent methyltransferase n=1 Tax=Novilysobacter arseniciresistens TaxID=1385522 RepID=UPI0009DFB11B|nr:class I SAM-dependent methyltransferase [Lysobacter arseniciresistens]
MNVLPPDDQHPRTSGQKRLPHAVLDRDSRILKAKKIIAIVGQERFFQARRILEVGCGSGVISSTLSSLGSVDLEIDGVDIVDSRIEKSGYTFQLIGGTSLPFPDDYFDIVITNHVIEHVGDEVAQNQHLQEIGRVVSPSGIVYLAVPNKWRLIEPHYRLPLLSWLPRRFSDRYIRLTRRGSHYDCLPLSHSKARELFEASAFSSRDVTCEAMRRIIEIEHPSSFAQWVNRLTPNWALRMFLPVIPTFIFLLHPEK